MSAWSELERVALLGTRRETLKIPGITPALDSLLSGLKNGDAEHILLSSAGTLDIYEQIGRTPARVKPDLRALAPQETLPACPPHAAAYIAQMLEGRQAEGGVYHAATYRFDDGHTSSGVESDVRADITGQPHSTCNVLPQALEAIDHRDTDTHAGPCQVR